MNERPVRRRRRRRGLVGWLVGVGEVTEIGGVSRGGLVDDGCFCEGVRWSGWDDGNSSESPTFNMALAASSSPTISSRPGRPSSDSLDLSCMKEAHLAKRKLSLTISLSSGKCHEYHSRTRIAKVLMSCVGGGMVVLVLVGIGYIKQE